MVMIANLFDAGQWGGGRSRAPKPKDGRRRVANHSGDAAGGVDSGTVPL